MFLRQDENRTSIPPKCGDVPHFNPTASTTSLASARTLDGKVCSTPVPPTKHTVETHEPSGKLRISVQPLTTIYDYRHTATMQSCCSPSGQRTHPLQRRWTLTPKSIGSNSSANHAHCHKVPIPRMHISDCVVLPCSTVIMAKESKVSLAVLRASLPLCCILRSQFSRWHLYSTRAQRIGQRVIDRPLRVWRVLLHPPMQQQKLAPNFPTPCPLPRPISKNQCPLKEHREMQSTRKPEKAGFGSWCNL